MTELDQDDAWSIAVKAVGTEPSGETGPTSTEQQRDFHVTVSPEDDLSCLHQQIETVTGLKASQQRLIYRGRLIGATKTDSQDTTAAASESVDNAVTSVKPTVQKIKDIVGLSDGQTIHLVKKRDAPEPERPGDEPNDAAMANTASSENAPETEVTSSGTNAGTASLLAALLGLGSLEEPANATEDPASRSFRARQYGSRRRLNYRLTEDDVQDVPDPGSAEPVRQSLMTLHTLLPQAQTVPEVEDPPPSPLDVARRWYRGQWIDCRDTVNQWLEATVVDVLYPADILPGHAELAPPAAANQTTTPTMHPANDPAVGASDLDGRRRLLLEPCMEGDIGDLGGELGGFRQRFTNASVQILLIHYNGWPHRWDEWIRSDSERIRPFRVRTRHPSRSTHASPTPQSVFPEQPCTFVRTETEGQDREALLPELARVLEAVNVLVSNAAAASQPVAAQETVVSSELPWTLCQASTANDRDHNEETEGDDTHADESSVVETITPLAEVPSAANTPQPVPSGLSRRELEVLAPLLDRLGRTLIDAAPHVASLAAALPDHTRVEEATEAEETPPELEPVDEHPSTLGGLLSLLSRDRRRTSTTSSSQQVANGDNVSAVTPSEQTVANSEAPANLDPDYTDFATGLVNTSRGEVRAGPRSRAATTNNDDLSNVLGAYLASASMGESENGEDNGNSQGGLGRLLRDRGNGGGIDIHIHAVVTAPGMTPGGLGLATLAGTPPAPAGNVFSQTRDRRNNGSMLRLRSPAVPQEEDDNGIFSELYSENPTPVNPNQSPSERERSIAAAAHEDRTRRHPPARSDGASVTPGRPSTNRSSSSRRSGSSRSSNRGLLGRLFRRSNTGE